MSKKVSRLKVFNYKRNQIAVFAEFQHQIWYLNMQIFLSEAHLYVSAVLLSILIEWLMRSLKN